MTLAAFSRYGVTVTVPELEEDIDAQLRALLDPNHPKQAVFLARGNSLGRRKLPEGVFVEDRPEGMLITTSATMASLFRQQQCLTDTDIAHLLGYPQSKADVFEAGEGCVVQALDGAGCVIFEAASSGSALVETLKAAQRQFVHGGSIEIVSIASAVRRRTRKL